ncbi:MAG: 50S ribosomal protein L1 [Candidatus Aenigmarchaeota archaeon]|nr:50S ribosomal protein L1 [Candidatus Aenigmarchaeota archaeon]
MQIAEAVKAARESEKREFKQSFDLSINISGLDLKKPENRISKEILLPHGRGKLAKVCLISDSGDYEEKIGKGELESLGNNKKEAKNLARSYDFFMSEPQLMVAVGKSIGKYLGPVGKMPKVVPPGTDVNKTAQQLSKSVRLRIKDSPVIHCTVGTEDMSDSQISENVNAVLGEMKKMLPGKGKIRNAYLKLTMGKSAKIDVTQ